MDIGTLHCLQRLAIIERCIKNSVCDGVIYDDECVQVKRENGEIVFSGKPIKYPFIMSGETA